MPTINWTRLAADVVDELADYDVAHGTHLSYYLHQGEPEHAPALAEALKRAIDRSGLRLADPEPAAPEVPEVVRAGLQQTVQRIAEQFYGIDMITHIPIVYPVAGTLYSGQFSISYQWLFRFLYESATQGLFIEPYFYDMVAKFRQANQPPQPFDINYPYGGRR